MTYGKHNWSHICVSGGLGIVFLWIGLDILNHPDAWIGFIPKNVPFGFSTTNALRLNGIFDIALGSMLILRFWPKITALLAAAHLIAILVTQGIDAVVIRDVGLLGGALALLLWPKRHHRNHHAP